MLEDTSATIYNEIKILIAKLLNECNKSQALQSKPRLRVLLYMEVSQAYLVYGRVQKAEEFLLQARELAGLKLELTGMLRGEICDT